MYACAGVCLRPVFSYVRTRQDDPPPHGLNDVTIPRVSAEAPPVGPPNATGREPLNVPTSPSEGEEEDEDEDGTEDDDDDTEGARNAKAEKTRTRRGKKRLHGDVLARAPRALARTLESMKATLEEHVLDGEGAEMTEARLLSLLERVRLKIETRVLLKEGVSPTAKRWAAYALARLSVARRAVSANNRFAMRSRMMSVLRALFGEDEEDALLLFDLE